jgi:hypothetical protein
VRKLSGVLLPLFVFSSVLAAQDHTAELLENAVEIRGDKMVVEEYTLDRIAPSGYQPVQLQVRRYAEAPAEGVISRDYFVALSAVLHTMIMQQALAEVYDLPASTFLKTYDSKDLEAPIGSPDLEISLFVTADGLQIEVRDNNDGITNRHTSTWSEFFQD